MADRPVVESATHRSSSAMNNVLTLILAGGKGSRLEPLTTHRAKPAVPFGGAYRIIDFALSNCVNSGLRRVFVLTQYKSASLARHLTNGWRFLSRETGDFVEALHPQQRIHDDWYRGTAEAVYQNIFTIDQNPSEHVVILSGDHIYQMDYSELVQQHVDRCADATIACLPVTIAEGREFGIMSVDENARITSFDEKPQHPMPLAHDPTRTLASMGVYCFRTEFLLEELIREANIPDSSFDFGKDIIPRLINSAAMYAHPFEDPDTGNCRYWRDVGTISAYYEANMELLSPTPGIDLYRSDWPTRTHSEPLPPPMFQSLTTVTAKEDEQGGRVSNSLVSPGCIVHGNVNRSILGPLVRVGVESQVDGCLIHNGATIGRNVRLKNVIVEKGCEIPDDTSLGFDQQHDMAHGCVIDHSGIRILPQGKIARSQPANA